jgi:hypothetical protein
LCPQNIDPRRKPGDPDGSKLWQRVSSNGMPKDGPLKDAEKATLKRWIEVGAPAWADDAGGDDGRPARPKKPVACPVERRAG